MTGAKGSDDHHHVARASHRDRCAITGIGAHRVLHGTRRERPRRWRSAASRAAIADAGLRPADIDGIVRNDMDLVTHNALADALGIPDLTYWGDRRARAARRRRR